MAGSRPSRVASGSELPGSARSRALALRPRTRVESIMNNRTLLLIILIILLLAVLPTWPYSTGWGYYPSGGLGLLLLIVIILLLLGRV